MLNLDLDKMQTGDVILKAHTYKDFIYPIFDIAGSKELTASSPLHIATPLDCLTNNMLLQPYTETDSEGNVIGWPSEKNGKDFSCIMTHREIMPYGHYYSLIKYLPAESCTVSKLVLDGKIVKTAGSFCPEEVGTINIEKTYSFKTLSDYIMEHKSPTDEEYGIELKEMITPSLASDRDRYVDYLDGNATYKKIAYPNFFRITLDRTELNYPGANAKIKALLDAKTAEMKTLGGDVDLYKMLSADEKALNSVIEGVLWNNMRNATLKYANTLERSLDIDGEKKISADDKMNNYEIAYLGAPGDAKNMYLKVDPEVKNPVSAEIAEIMDSMNTYHGLIDGANIANMADENSKFKC